MNGRYQVELAEGDEIHDSPAHGVGYMPDGMRKYSDADHLMPNRKSSLLPSGAWPGTVALLVKPFLECKGVTPAVNIHRNRKC